MKEVPAGGPACVIFNPRAGSADRIAELQELLQEDARYHVYPTSHAGHAREIAATLTAERAAVILAAGGDGTINEIVSGIMQARDGGIVCPTLMIVTMGTGNDLSRTLNHPATLPESLALLETGRARSLDVLRWSLIHADGGPERRGWCVNVAAGGFSARLKEALTPEMKKRWGPLAYARAALSSVDELEPHDIRYSIDGGPEQASQAINVIIANARFAGGGIEVAPQADPSDGLLDLVVITPGDWLDLAEVATHLIAGEVDASDNTFHLTGRTLKVSGEPPLPFNIDGDPVGEGTLEVQVVPGALQVIVPAAEEMPAGA